MAVNIQKVSEQKSPNYQSETPNIFQKKQVITDKTASERQPLKETKKETEQHTDNRLYTNTDKYKYMIDKNPDLQKLVKCLGLNFD